MNAEHDQEQADKNALRRWGDEHQYDAAPMQANYSEETGVLPKVHLISMTPDPLGAVAAAARMYKGMPTYSMNDITDEERRHAWQQVQKTHLQAPLEFVNFHFFIEGVDRAFTHQMVRQRTAVYAQESMRFAVQNGEFRKNTSLPPSLHGTHERDGVGMQMPATNQEQRWRDTWDSALDMVESAYSTLVQTGMPAEEARGLLPHAMATRLNYHTNLRAMLQHAGNRLCTQAQFHWRIVWAQIANEIMAAGEPWDDGWQHKEIAKVFKPICYQLGHCAFDSSYDRSCSIRERVEGYAANGVPSRAWHLGWESDETNEHGEPAEKIDPIYTSEWALDPSAARKH